MDLNDLKKEGPSVFKRKTMFIISFKIIAELHHNNIGTNNKNLKDISTMEADLPRLRSFAEIGKIVHLSAIPRLHMNKRLSVNEKRRRQIVETLKAIILQNNQALVAKLYTFLQPLTEYDQSFLLHDSNDKKNVAKLRGSNGHSGHEGKVALATSRRHFSEQYLVLTKNECLFLLATQLL